MGNNESEEWKNYYSTIYLWNTFKRESIQSVIKHLQNNTKDKLQSMNKGERDTKKKVLSYCSSSHCYCVHNCNTIQYSNHGMFKTT